MSTGGRTVAIVAGLILFAGALVIASGLLERLSKHDAEAAIDGVGGARRPRREPRERDRAEPPPPPRWDQLVRKVDEAAAAAATGAGARPILTPPAGPRRDAPTGFDRAEARARLAALGLRLSGVAWTPAGVPLALFRDRTMRVGEAVDGFEVAAIDAGGVTLVSGLGIRVRLIFPDDAVEPAPPPELDPASVAPGRSPR